MKIKHIMLPLAVAAMIATPAFAQAPEDESYNGDSYVITPPANWLLISGTLTPKELAKLPENIREHYNQRNNSDVIFMNIDALDAETKGFKNTLNIVSINESIPISDELVKELSTILSQQYDSMFAQTFKMEDSKIIELDSVGKAFYLSGTYTIQDYTIKMEQALVPTKSESLVITCSYETGKPDTEETAAKCDAALKSLKLK